MSKVITRGNTVEFSIVFYDADGNLAAPDSAELQVVYVGYDGYRTAEVALTEDAGAWVGTWDSSVAKGGWVEWSAEGLDGATALVQDGRFKISSNRASLQRDRLEGMASGNDYAE